MGHRPSASQWDQAADIGDAAASKTGAAEVFLAASQRAPLLALLQGLERGESLIAITGEANVGKTTLLESVLPAGQGGGTQTVWCRSEAGEQLDRARAVLEAATRDLELDVSGAAPNRQPAHCKRTIVVIDDAHLLTPEDAGYFIGFLDSAGAGSRKLQLVLVGRPALWTHLQDAGVVDRVKISGELAGLPPSEAREYLRERLEPSGTPIDDILTDGARLALLRRGRWTPVALNEVMSNAGDVPVDQGAGWITQEIVERVASSSGPAGGEDHPLDDHLTGEVGSVASVASRLQARKRPVRHVAMAMAALLAVLASGAVYWSLAPTPADPLVAERGPSKPDTRPSSEPAAGAGQQASAATAPLLAVPPPELANRQPSVAPNAEFAATAANEPPKPAVSAKPADRPASQQAQSPDGLDARNPRSVPTMTVAQLDAIFRLGETMLARGDIAAARVLYRRAAMANSGAAATVVGKTYDPIFLTGIGATKIKPAPSRAAAWYQRAARLGDKEGRDRLAQLRSWTSQVARND